MARIKAGSLRIKTKTNSKSLRIGRLDWKCTDVLSSTGRISNTSAVFSSYSSSYVFCRRFLLGIWKFIKKNHQEKSSRKKKKKKRTLYWTSFCQLTWCTIFLLVVWANKSCISGPHYLWLQFGCFIKSVLVFDKFVYRIEIRRKHFIE